MDTITYLPLTYDVCEEALTFWADIEGVYIHPSGEDSIEGIRGFLDRNPGFSFIARDGIKLVGAIMSGHDCRRAFIYHLAVDSSYRRHGIGTQLLQLSLEQIRNAGIKKSALFVLKSNAIGDAFYKSQNWVEETGVKIYAQIL